MTTYQSPQAARLSTNVVVPTAPWEWVVYDVTAGTFTLTVKTHSGTGVAVSRPSGPCGEQEAKPDG